MSRVLIQKAIREAIKIVPCVIVQYDSNRDAEYIVDVSTKSGYKETLPSSVLTNEVHGDYTVDKDYGRAEVLKKSNWYFKAIVAYKTEVDIQNLERALCKPLKVLVTDGKCAKVSLRTSDMDHGTTGAKTSGTVLSLVFNATPPRN